MAQERIAIRLKVSQVVTVILFFSALVIIFLLFVQSKLNNETKLIATLSEYNVLNPKIFHLQDSGYAKDFFESKHGKRCFKSGITDISLEEGCACKIGWNGHHCEVPDFIWSSDWFLASRQDVGLKLSNKLRRIVLTSWFDERSSIELFGLRVQQLFDVVDVFFVVESNFTQNCSSKTPVLLNHLRNGFLKEYQQKIVYSLMHTCPPSGIKTWTDFHQLISGIGVFHLISDYRPNDFIIFSGPDELISKDYLTFLKLFTNIPEPLTAVIRKSVFGFQFPLKYPEEEIPTIVGSTVKYLMSVCDDHTLDLLANGCDKKNPTKVQKYQKIEEDNIVLRWSPSRSYNMWWKCKWCLPVSNMQSYVREIEDETGVRLTFEKIYSSSDNVTTWSKKALVIDTSKMISTDGDKNPIELPAILSSNFNKYSHLLSGNFSHVDFGEMSPSQ